MATTRVCDIHGGEVPKLTALKESYQLPHIKEICDDCLSKLEKHMTTVYKAHEKELEQMVRDFVVTLRTETT